MIFIGAICVFVVLLVVFGLMVTPVLLVYAADQHKERKELYNKCCRYCNKRDSDYCYVCCSKYTSYKKYKAFLMYMFELHCEKCSLNGASSCDRCQYENAYQNHKGKS